jgi:hypothetical protein
MPFPEPDEQQNEDIIFLTSIDAHFGHFVSFWSLEMLRRRENCSWHVKQIYS